MNFSQAYQWSNLSYLLDGLKITMGVTVLTITLSLIFGTLIGMVRYLKIPGVSAVVGFIVDTIRNLPLLLIIFFTYFALPQIGLHFNIFWSTVFAMTTFESCMVSEIVRAGLVAVPKGQREAAIATGLSTPQTLFYIILPQAFRSSLPALVSQLIALIKDTSLATIISLPELMHNARIIYNQQIDAIVPIFIIVTAMYWLICYGLSRIATFIHHRLPM